RSQDRLRSRGIPDWIVRGSRQVRDAEASAPDAAAGAEAGAGVKERILSLDLGKLLPALVAGGVGVFLVCAAFGLFNPRDTSQPEGVVVAGALRVARSEPLFLDIRKGPYVTAMYGPFLYLALGWLAKTLGLGVGGTYLLGR